MDKRHGEHGYTRLEGSGGQWRQRSQGRAWLGQRACQVQGFGLHSERDREPQSSLRQQKDVQSVLQSPHWLQCE